MSSRVDEDQEQVHLSDHYAWPLVIGLTAVCVGFAYFASTYPFMDFDVYYQTATRMRDGLGIYDNPPEQRPFTYPPVAAYLMAPMAFVSNGVAAYIFTITSLLCLGRACQLMIRTALPRMDHRARLLAASAVPAAFLVAEPSEFTIAFGQINFMLLWLVCEDTLGRRLLPRGTLTGVAAAIKLTPIVFAAAWLLAGRIKTAAYAGGTFAASILLGHLVAPGASAAFWGTHLRDVGRVGVVQYAHNQSFNGMLWRILGDGGNRPLWVVLCLVTGVAALLTARHFQSRGDDLGVLAVMGVAMTLVSPIAWGHHWVWAYPAVIWLVGALWSDRPHRVLLLTAVPVFWARLVHEMPQGDDIEFSGPLYIRILESPYVYWGVAFVATLFTTRRVWRSLPRLRTRRPTATPGTDVAGTPAPGAPIT